MKKIIKIKQSELVELVNRVISENINEQQAKSAVPQWGKNIVKQFGAKYFTYNVKSNFLTFKNDTITMVFYQNKKMSFRDIAFYHQGSWEDKNGIIYITLDSGATYDTKKRKWEGFGEAEPVEVWMMRFFSHFNGSKSKDYPDNNAVFRKKNKSVGVFDDQRLGLVIYSNHRFVYNFWSGEQRKGSWKELPNDEFILIEDAPSKWFYDSRKGEWLKKEDGTPNAASAVKTVKTINEILAGKGYLAKGMKGPIVGELQKIMLKLNLSISKNNTVDYIFGPIMDKSVRQFQGDNMLEIDGKVGRRTLKKMIEIRDYGKSTETTVQKPKTAQDYLPKDLPTDALEPQLPPEELL